MSKYGPTPEPEEYCDGCDDGDGWYCCDCKKTFEVPDQIVIWGSPVTVCPTCGSIDIAGGCGKTEDECRLERKRQAAADRDYEEKTR